MGSDRGVLVVDDEPQILEVYRQVFSHAGYAVLAAASGEEALEMVAESPPQVLFLDLHLPGMSGLELCRRIHEHCPTAIAYAVTGYAGLFEIHEWRDAGFEDCFLKPVRMAVLLEAASHAFAKLQRWAQSDQPPRATIIHSE